MRCTVNSNVYEQASDLYQQQYPTHIELIRKLWLDRLIDDETLWRISTQPRYLCVEDARLLCHSLGLVPFAGFPLQRATPDYMEQVHQDYERYSDLYQDELERMA